MLRVTSYIKGTVKFIPENLCLLGFSYRVVCQISTEGSAETPQTDTRKGQGVIHPWMWRKRSSDKGPQFVTCTNLGCHLFHLLPSLTQWDSWIQCQGASDARTAPMALCGQNHDCEGAVSGG